jgi:23S rRNA pseudouridine1911/1915/1917 synthase
MLEEGRATFDGMALGPSTRVGAGAELVATVPAPFELEPEPVGFAVLFDDAEVAVVDKPPGVVVHPGAGNQRGTLAAGLLHRWPQLRGVGEVNRWGIVHRLDRDTSGALLVAKTAAAHATLSAALAKRAVVRTYTALVMGGIDISTGTIDAPIGRDPGDPTRLAVRAGGRSAVTHYEVTRSLEGMSLLRVTLETGRTHQIRVHLASIGHPVCGDGTYGSGGGPPLPRIFLHASAVTFPHRGEMVTVESPLPPDLADALAPLLAEEGPGDVV